MFQELKGSSPFFLIAGPNVIQSEEHCIKLCGRIKEITDRLGVRFVFKASFDKANRTSAKSFRGPGLQEGLRCIAPAPWALAGPRSHTSLSQIVTCC